MHDSIVEELSGRILREVAMTIGHAMTNASIKKVNSQNFQLNTRESGFVSSRSSHFISMWLQSIKGEICSTYHLTKSESFYVLFIFWDETRSCTAVKAVTNTKPLWISRGVVKIGNSLMIWSFLDPPVNKNAHKGSQQKAVVSDF